MRTITRAAALGLAVGLAVLFATPTDAYAAKRDKKNTAQQNASSDSGKDGKWWQFWKRHREEKEEPIWQGWTRSGHGTGNKSSKPAFEQKRTKTRLRGEDPREQRVNPLKAKKSTKKHEPNVGNPRVNKRYHKETFSHKPDAKKSEKSVKRSGQQMRRMYMLQPQKKQKESKFSHKGGGFRND